MLRQLLDKVEPLFHKGGPLEKLYPLYEANDTFLYTPAPSLASKKLQETLNLLLEILANFHPQSSCIPC